MAAATSIVPFQPPVGLPPSQALAHAVSHIDKIVKKHQALKEGHDALLEVVEETKGAVQSAAKKHYRSVVETMFVAAAGGGLGFINGRYGGEKGHVAFWDVPVDGTLAVVGHVTGLVVGHVMDGTFGEDLSRACHAVGNTATGVLTYRLGHQKGVERAQRANAAAPAAQANGAKGGTVYTVAPPHK